MNDEINDMDPSENKLPATLDSHLRNMMSDDELDRFREQLPVDFLSDASEGLDHFKDTQQLDSVFGKLNRQMRRHLSHKKKRKKRNSSGGMTWSYWALAIILIVSIAGYIVVRMFLHS